MLPAKRIYATTSRSRSVSGRRDKRERVTMDTVDRRRGEISRVQGDESDVAGGWHRGPMETQSTL